MADIASAIDKMNTDEVAQDKPLTESFFTKTGANINGLIDRVVGEDLVDRVDTIESRLAQATHVGEIYVSPWLLPEDIGFSNEVHPGYTHLTVGPNAQTRFVISNFIPTGMGTIFIDPFPVAPVDSYEIDNPFGSATLINDTSANQVTIDFKIISGRWNVRYKLVRYEALP